MIVLMILINIALASPNSFKSPDVAVNNFFSSLSSNVNGKSDDPAMNQVVGQLKEDVKYNGSIKSTKVIDTVSRLNGSQQFLTYEIEFSNGRKKQVKFQVMRPTLSGDYYLTGTSFPD